MSQSFDEAHFGHRQIPEHLGLPAKMLRNNDLADFGETYVTCEVTFSQPIPLVLAEGPYSITTCDFKSDDTCAMFCGLPKSFQ
jgi:hypothetical protein